MPETIEAPLASASNNSYSAANRYLARIAAPTIATLRASASALAYYGSARSSAETLGLLKHIDAANIVSSSRGLSRAFKAGAPVMRIGGKILPFIGAAVASTEVMALTKEAHAGHSNGVISTPEYVGLAGIYLAHVAQGGFDPTGFGGEAIVQGAYSKLSEDWPEAVQASLQPSTIAELIAVESKPIDPKRLKFERVIENIETGDVVASPETERLLDLYNRMVQTETEFESASHDNFNMSTPRGMQEIIRAKTYMDDAHQQFEDYYYTLESDHKWGAVFKKQTKASDNKADAPVTLCGFETASSNASTIPTSPNPIIPVTYGNRSIGLHH